jgi:phosphoribosylamine--glycine ligase
MKWYPMASLCVVIASEGYPGSSPKGRPIHGLDGLAQQPGLQVFHAGTTLKDGQVVTSGGRVLGVTAWAPSLIEAQKAAYSACDQICFEGMQFRRDIGAKGLVRT